MEVTVSSKYQVVIPKSVRKKSNIRPGQKLKLENLPNGDITIKTVPTMKSVLDKYAGKMSGGPWGKDPVKYIKDLRVDRS